MLAALLLAGPGPVLAATATPQARVIVKLKDIAAATAQAQGADADGAAAELGTLARRHGVEPRGQRALGGRVRLMTADGIDSATLARRLAADPDVAYAVPDRRMRRNVAPSDTLYASGGGAGPTVGQWYLQPPDATLISAIDAQTAWDTAKGDGVVVAVLDTGVRSDHPDLVVKLLPGFDFVADVDTAADGDGRDADPADPGDFVTQADLDGSLGQRFDDCTLADSSWHGTKVAGMIGAHTNNGLGIAGSGWNAKVLPVRVLGKCGGFESDIVLAMKWAAGIHVDGVPDNPAANHAKVINLSLGGEGDCRAAYADAVAQVTARGAVVVASAGNTVGHRVSAPANCDGVIAVGGLRHIGTKVGFSDLGPEVAISAPGGNCVNVASDQPCLFPLITTTNAGVTTPAPASAAYTNGSTDVTVGTSFSAPLVAGTVALMMSAQPALTPLQLKLMLQATARPFPTTGGDPGEDANGPVELCTAPQFDASGAALPQLQCYCSTGTCGAGMLDARAAVLAAVTGTPAATVRARIDLTPVDPAAGEPLQLSAAKSLVAAGRLIASHQWSLVDGGGIVSAVDGADAQVASVTPSGPGRIVVQLTVTDDMGASSESTLAVMIGEPPAPPADDGGGGGGGGALSLGYLFALLAACIAARRAAPRRRGSGR